MQLNIQMYRRRHRGFSLVELLVVITVIGVIAAIAIPSLSFAHENSRVAIAKRNAQQIASIFGAGEGVGAPGFRAASSLESAVNAVGTGSWGGGITSDSFFQVPGASFMMDNGKPVAEQAIHYLSWTGTSLIYQENGNAAPPVDDRPWTDGALLQTAQQALGWVEISIQVNPGMEFRVSPSNPLQGQWRPKVSN